MPHFYARVCAIVTISWVYFACAKLVAADLGYYAAIGIADSPSQATTSQISDLGIVWSVDLSNLTPGCCPAGWELVTTLAEQTIATKDRTLEQVFIRTFKTNNLGLGVGYTFQNGPNLLVMKLLGGPSSSQMRINSSTQSSSQVSELRGLSGSFGYISSSYKRQLSGHVSLEVGARVGLHEIKLGQDSIFFSGQQIEEGRLELTEITEKSGTKPLPQTLRFQSIQAILGLSIEL